ncbi:MAG: heliorhodopsin HeR [Thermoleophilia bacterium]
MNEVTESKITFTGLRRFNFIMGCLHLAQGVLMLILSASFTLPITTLYLKFDKASVKLVQNLQEPYSLRIAPLVALFLLLSALAHFTLASWGYKWYVEDLQRQINKARWIEYALSSSIMIVLIAMLVGVYDLSSLILIFSINAWVVIALYTLGSNSSPDTSVPGFVYGIMVSLFVFFNIFAVNMILQYKKVGPWRGSRLNCAC